MNGILLKWLHECLGLTVPVENLGEYLSDGVILATLLRNHNVVNDKAIKYILPSNNINVRKNNLHQLCVWLNVLDIKVDNEMIHNIACGKATATLKLLYELYLKLNSRKTLQSVITEQKKRPKDGSSKKSLCKFLKARHGKLFHHNKEILIKDSCHDSVRGEEDEEEGEEEEEKEQVKQKRQTYLLTTRKEDSSLVLGKKETFYEQMRREDIFFVRNILKTPTYLTIDNKRRLSPRYQALLDNIQSVTEELHEEQESDQEWIEPKTIPDSWAESSKYSDNLTHDMSAQKTESDIFRKEMSHKILQQSNYEKHQSAEKFQAILLEKNNQETFLRLSQTVEEETTDYSKFFSTCKTSEEEIACQMETINKMELHRRLYDEKIKRRNKRHRIMCQHIISDIIDLAVKVSKYGKNLVTEELMTEWKQMLIMGIPLHISSEQFSDISLIVTDDREPTMKLCHFDDYNHLVGIWFDQTGLDVSYDDQLVLAHVVYRLQDCKLPPVIPIVPAAIPRYRITAVLNCSIDELTMLKLETLLAKSKIRLIDMKSAIQFCIERYKIEADIKPPEIPSKKGKKTPKSKSGTGDTTKTNSKGKKKSPVSVNTFKDEEVQTSDSLLDNMGKQTELSETALVGKRLYDSPNLDNISTDTLIDVLIEFLKTQFNIEGWLLINFPSTLREAYELEKTLSGKKYPKVFGQNDKELKTSDTVILSNEEIDETTVKRSRLVHLPEQKEEIFETYFTSFINVIKNDSDTIHHSLNHGDTEDEMIEEEEEHENEIVINLRTIYTKQNILKDFYFETMDFTKLKELARFILQVDSDIERVPSNELFSDEVIQHYDQPKETVGTALKTPKKTATKKTPKGKDEISLAKEFLEKLIVSLQTPLEELNFDPDNTSRVEHTTEQAEPEANVCPGEVGWFFANYPLAEGDGIDLANIWQEMEDGYIKKVEEVLNTNEEHNSLIRYYVNFIIKVLTGISRVDNENDIKATVNNFIQYFNHTLEHHKLDNALTKTLSNAIFNLEIYLWKRSSKWRNMVESERQHLIGHNWTTGEMIEITMTYSSLIEAEVNRTNTTLYILCKYYCSMCGEIPLHEEIPLVSAISNSMHFCENECKIKCIIAKILIDKNELNLPNPIIGILQQTAVRYSQEISLLKAKFDEILEHYKFHMLDIAHRFVYNYPNGSTTIYQSKDIVELGEEEDQTVDKQLQSSTVSMIVENNTAFQYMFNEWSYAVKSELDRLCWRIRIVTAKAIDAVDDLADSIINIFYKFYDETVSNFLKENECIDNLCQLFHSAIKNRMPVTGQVVVENNCVFIEQEILDDPNRPSYETVFERTVRDHCFTINQLESIMERLKVAAPDGIIRKRALRFFVEDMIFHEFSEHTHLLPKFWANLSSFELRQVWKTAFGATSILYWKNFLLYCLDITFPDMEDIINYKQQFSLYDKENRGIISYQDYMNITLWFEEETDNLERGSRQQSIKEFIFKVFKVDENEMDYNKFFLLFSKGHSPASGFAKALAYLSGQCTVVNEQSAHLENIMTEYNDLLSKMVREILDEMVFGALNELYGVKIEELVEEQGTNTSQGTSTSISIAEVRQSGLMRNTWEAEAEYKEYGEEWEEEDKSINDKGSQTVSFSELMYDQYISNNKLFKWTTKVTTEVINNLLDTLVYPILEFNDDGVIMIDIIKQDVEDTLNKLEENGLVSVASLVKENAIQLLFMCTHTFQIVSFPSMSKNFEENCLF